MDSHVFLLVIFVFIDTKDQSKRRKGAVLNWCLDIAPNNCYRNKGGIIINFKGGVPIRHKSHQTGIGLVVAGLCHTGQGVRLGLLIDQFAVAVFNLLHVPN